MRTVDGIILGAVMLIVAIAAFFAVRRKKCGSCCGDCCSCASACEKKNGAAQKKG